MRVATYQGSAGERVGVLATDQTLVAVSDLVPGGPHDMLGLLEGGHDLWERVRAAAATARGGASLSSVELLAPIPRPRRNIMCVGWNYSEHFLEGQGMRGGQEPAEIPEYPALFSKQPNCVVGPGAAVLHPSPISDRLDWEAELAVIIGRPGRDIAEDDAYGRVFGYTVGNDISVRDLQRRHGGQWFKGKSFDTHCPLGPWIVTTDEIPDPHALRISLKVNGVTKQDSSTRYMVFRIPRIIKELSTGMRLLPGDVILTGTPEGVGFARKPPEFLKVGDVIETEIEAIGLLRNPVVAFEATEAKPAAAGAKAG